MVAFLSLTLQFSVQRPKNPAYPTELITIGDHLRTVRLDRDLYQTDVAKILKTSAENINNWEHNHKEPHVTNMKGVIEFIGYIPFEYEKGTLGLRLWVARQVAGVSHRKAAKELQIDPTTVLSIERGKRKPIEKIIDKCESFISNYVN